MGPQRPAVATLVRGLAAGLAGGADMTAFQRLVEMPLTGRDESHQPAALAVKLLRLPARRRHDRRLNHLVHFGVGAGWGAAHGLLATRAGLRGQRAVAAGFGTLWPADIVTTTALGLARPWRWSRRDLAVDVVDKLVLAEATGAVFDRLAARG